jgi:hypothetical protein
MLVILGGVAVGLALLALTTARQALAIARTVERRVQTTCDRVDARLDTVAAERANAQRVRDQVTRFTKGWSARLGSQRRN